VDVIIIVALEWGGNARAELCRPPPKRVWSVLVDGEAHTLLERSSAVLKGGKWLTTILERVGWRGQNGRSLSAYGVTFQR
jgi:hypothetical protein